MKDLRTGGILLQGPTKDGVYEWPAVTTFSTYPFLAFFSVITTSSAWHHRLGHPSSIIFKHIMSSFKLDYSNVFDKNSHCNSCQCNKSHKLPFSVSTISSSSPLEILFSDVWTSHLSSINGYKYYVVFVDHFTKYTWLYPLKWKSHVFDVFV